MKKMPVIKQNKMAGIFLHLTHKHTFGIMTNIERMFSLKQINSLYWQYMDCKIDITDTYKHTDSEIPIGRNLIVIVED